MRRKRLTELPPSLSMAAERSGSGRVVSRKGVWGERLDVSKNHCYISVDRECLVRVNYGTAKAEIERRRGVYLGRGIW